MKKLVYLFLVLFLITFASAQLNYNNRNLPRIEAPKVITANIPSVSNVSSVTSSDACITVNPTTGDVVLTFNTSCATGSSFNATYAKFAYNESSWLIGVYGQFWYNMTSPVFLQNLLNDTIANYGVRVGFNGTYNASYDALNSTYGKFWYNQTQGVFNATYDKFAYNQTMVQSVTGISPYTLVDPTQGLVNISINETKLNNTISDVGFRVGFNSTYNASYLVRTGDTATGEIDVDMTSLGAWMAFEFFSTQVGRITSENSVFQIMGLPGFFATWLGDCGSACLIAGTDGIFQMSAIKSNQIKTNNLMTMEINRTQIIITTNNTIFINPNSTLMFQINSTRITLYTNTSINGNLNATSDICVTNGKCLNKTIILNSEPTYNASMIWWNNNTGVWNVIPEPPANNEAPVYCTSGSTPRWTFIDKDSGACPL